MFSNQQKHRRKSAEQKPGLPYAERNLKILADKIFK